MYFVIHVIEKWK